MSTEAQSYLALILAALKRIEERQDVTRTPHGRWVIRQCACLPGRACVLSTCPYKDAIRE